MNTSRAAEKADLVPVSASSTRGRYHGVRRRDTLPLEWRHRQPEALELRPVELRLLLVPDQTIAWPVS